MFEEVGVDSRQVVTSLVSIEVGSMYVNLYRFPNTSCKPIRVTIQYFDMIPTDIMASIHSMSNNRRVHMTRASVFGQSLSQRALRFANVRRRTVLTRDVVHSARSLGELNRVLW